MREQQIPHTGRSAAGFGMTRMRQRRGRLLDGQRVAKELRRAWRGSAALTTSAMPLRKNRLRMAELHRQRSAKNVRRAQRAAPLRKRSRPGIAV